MPTQKARDLTHTLVAGLKEMISSGALHSGSRLLPERELARQFGVNRGSIRQALKALEIIGIVHQRVGDGTYLSSDGSSVLAVPFDFLILADGISFAELFEARRIVEPALAARAAECRSDADLVEMAAALAAIRDHPGTSGEEMAAQDLRFHEAVWRAAGNRVYQRTLASLHRSVSRGLAVACWLGHEGLPAPALEEIFSAITGRDGSLARQLMDNYLARESACILSGVCDEVSVPC